MKKVNIKKLINKTGFMKYKELLIETEYIVFVNSWKGVKKTLNKLEREKGLDFLNRYLPLLFHYFEDVKENFNIRLDFPHPVLLENKKIISFLNKLSEKKTSSQEKIEIGKYIPELLLEMHSLLREGNKEDLENKIKNWERIYGKRDVGATLYYVYQLLGKRRDDFLSKYLDRK